MPSQTFIISRPPEAVPIETRELQSLINGAKRGFEWSVLETTNIKTKTCAMWRDCRYVNTYECNETCESFIDSPA